MRGMILFSLVILLSACGGSIDTPETLPAGYTLAEGDRVAIALASNWRAVPVTSQDFAATGDYLRQTNPRLAAKVDEMAQEIHADTLRLAAYHNSGTATLNIAAERAPGLTTASAVAEANRRGLENFGYRIDRTWTTSFGKRKVEATEAYIMLDTTAGKQIRMGLIQYTLVGGGAAYTISLGAPAHQIDDLRAEFEQMAQTIHTVN